MLPEPILDDLRFQRDLVDVARKRIIHYCPEWTDYNLSDPGITLIELFSWMTELIVYRLNRVPEKNYIKFLNMLGVQLQPPTSAKAELVFRLAAPFPLRPDDDTIAIVPKGTEVGTRVTDEEPEVIFTTDDRLVIASPHLTQLRQTEEFNKNYLDRLNVEVFNAFSRERPRQGDTFYVGFDEAHNIAGHIIRLEFKCQPALAPGIRREDPPLVWECSLGSGSWEELSLSKRVEEQDTTGGLNNELGSLTLYLPLTMKLDAVYGRNGYWLRCRFEQRHPTQGYYTESPRITGLAAFVLGSTTTATNAVYCYNEVIGTSNGDPNQIFQLAHYPILDLWPNETIEVQEMQAGELVFVPWQYTADFSDTRPFDRHFTLDTATGQVIFGPAIRQRDGTVRQYGRVPEMGRMIRMNQYRYGGGTVGNVPSGEVQVLKTALPYIDRVTNPRRASGGQDQETLDEAKMRAQRELRAQERAVTTQDYEHLTKRISREIARVKCNAPVRADGPLPPGMVELLIVPAATDALQVGDLSKLQISDKLVSLIQADLDQFRLLTTTLYVREPNYIGVKVKADIVAFDNVDPEMMYSRVVESLNAMICPLPLKAAERYKTVLGPEWAGWEFGRDLYVAEIFSLLQQVSGVKHVLDVQLYQREVIPTNEISPLSEEADTKEKPPLMIVEERVIRVPSDSLLCSLQHEVALKYL